MRHKKTIAKLGRTASHRKALMRNMALNLIMREKIRTTRQKAKALSAYVEKIITRAKKNDLHNKRMVARDIQVRKALVKLFDDIAPRYEKRPGGYTRIINIGTRPGDGADLVFIELVEEEFTPKVKTKKKAEKAEKAAAPAKTVEQEPVVAPAEDVADVADVAEGVAEGVAEEAVSAEEVSEDSAAAEETEKSAE